MTAVDIGEHFSYFNSVVYNYVGDCFTCSGTERATVRYAQPVTSPYHTGQASTFYL